LRLLLDSHYCLWLTLRRDRLRVPEFDALIDPNNDLAFSSISIWELRIKWDRRYVSGERRLDASPNDVLDGLRAVRLAVVDLTAELAAAPLRTPIPHGDPFDALLLAIAQETDRKLFTRDERLRGHPQAFHAN
jgi:PIN domain nuclease of toxin-antitoxin system